MGKIKLTQKQLKVFQLFNQCLTQKQVAKQLNCTQSYVCKSLKIVCERLGLDLNEGLVKYARKDIEKMKETDKRHNAWRTGLKRIRFQEIDKHFNEIESELIKLKQNLKEYYSYM